MENVVAVYKPLGKTPLQAVDQFKTIYPQYSHVKIGYAGRLDPMAEGILLLLLGEENLRRKEFEKLPKEYEFDVLFGISTDTYDTLGLIQQVQKVDNYDELSATFRELIPSCIGERTQSYPPYSSPRVRGKPLFYWAREGKLHEIVIPSKQISITSFDCLSWRAISVKELLHEALQRTQLVTGEFRQTETMNSWRKELETVFQNNFPIATCRLSCSSGTYIRSIAHEIGGILGIGALAYTIKRIKVGDFTEDNTLHIF